METPETSLQRARQAKQHGRELLGDLESFAGIGITQVGGRYAVKVNFSTAPLDRSRIPLEIDGVPVVLDVVGDIRKL